MDGWMDGWMYVHMHVCMHVCMQVGWSALVGWFGWLVGQLVLWFARLFGCLFACRCVNLFLDRPQDLTI